NGAARKRSSSRHAGRKAIKIVVDLEGFVVARYHDDALMRLTQYRRLLSQVIKIGVRIVHEPVAAKEIILLKLEVFIVHIGSPFELLPATEAFTTKPGLSGIVPGERIAGPSRPDKATNTTATARGPRCTRRHPPFPTP